MARDRVLVAPELKSRRRSKEDQHVHRQRGRQLKPHVSVPRTAICGDRRKTPNLTEVILVISLLSLLSPHIEFPLEAGGSRLQLENPPKCWRCVRGGFNDAALGSIQVFSRAFLGELHTVCSELCTLPMALGLARVLPPRLPTHALAHSRARGIPVQPELRPCLNAVAALVCRHDGVRTLDRLTD